MALAGACAALALTAPAHAADGVGFAAQSYAGLGVEAAGGAVTGQKPESKLWYANGSWWATMVSPAASGGHDIYRLSGAAWVDTGVLVDAEPTTREDVLWDGSHLYVLSRTPPAKDPEPARLRRFSWDGSAYALDAGFPVDVPGGGAEALTIAEDTTGTLWVTYTKGKSVFVAHSTGSDATWTAAAKLAFANAQNLKGDDISVAIAFTDASGPAVGVMWSNQAVQADYFAVHRDGAADTAWSFETVAAGPLQADDHLNLKSFEGRVYGAIKTSTTTSGNPLIELVVRSPTGGWTTYPVATYAEQNTRPIVLLDVSARQIDVFMSQGVSNAHGIVYEQSPLDAISFAGPSTYFIQGPNGESINDATSTKQNLDSTTGLVVLASDGSTYWWNATGVDLGGGGGGTVDEPPTARSTSTSTTVDTAVPVALRGSDAETCELDFAIVQQPAHGTLGPLSQQTCAAGSPNTDAAAVVYTPGAGFSGSDSFRYQVTDGSGQTASATVSLDVAPSPPPPPPPGGALAPSSLKVTTGSLASGDVGSLAAADGNLLQVSSSTGSAPKAGWYVLFSGVAASPSSLSVTYTGGASATCRQRLELRNWRTSSWDTIDDRFVGADTTLTVAVPGSLADYVSDGQVKLQALCGAASPFGFHTDAVGLTVGS